MPRDPDPVTRAVDALSGLGDLSEEQLEGPVPRAAWEDALLQQTLRAAGRRVAVRRALAAAALLAAFLGGALSASLWRTEVQRSRSPDPVQRAPSMEMVAVGGRAEPVDLEQEARSLAGEERWRGLQLAGDAYLYEEADVEAALRCYRELLDQGVAAAGAEVEESWLLQALRTSRAVTGDSKN